MDAASYYPDMNFQPLAEEARSEPTRDWKEFLTWLEGEKEERSTWIKILMQHSTSKPKREGGAPNPWGIIPLTQCRPLGAGWWEVAIPLPNSYNPKDGLQVEGVQRCPSNGFVAARERACRDILAKLLRDRPNQVRLMPDDWKRGPAELRRSVATLFPGGDLTLPATGAMDDQGLRRGPVMPGFQEPGPGEDRDTERRELLRQIIEHHRKLAMPRDPDPSDLDRVWKWRPRLDRLFQRGTPLLILNQLTMCVVLSVKNWILIKFRPFYY